MSTGHKESEKRKIGKEKKMDQKEIIGSLFTGTYIDQKIAFRRIRNMCVYVHHLLSLVDRSIRKSNRPRLANIQIVRILYGR